MNKESKTSLVDVNAMLAEATRLNDNGQHGAALKQAHHASEYVAAVYLSKITGKSLLPDDAAFKLFYETIHEPTRHADLLSEIEDVVGDVYVLREAYEPALLEETTTKDVRQMVDRVATMAGLVEELVGKH